MLAYTDNTPLGPQPEFSGNKKYQAVIEAWKEYFDNLSNKTDELVSWSTRNEELRANLLYAMGISLGYRFDKVLIKRNIYTPEGHGKDEQEKDAIRAGLATILKGEAAFPVYFVQDEEEAEKQQELRELMIRHYTPQAQQHKDEE
jgi:hypothetical protein